MKNVLLWIMAAFYAGMGGFHLIKPTNYLTMVPDWLPAPMFLVAGSGLVEISLALGLIWAITRRIAAMLIIGMLLVYLLLIHLPQTLHFYQTTDPALGNSVVRIGIQFLLIGWAYQYTKPVTQPVVHLATK
ncbi:DoxX family protein [Spirosoma sordidisoli]|uniref:DoxX family protein n=1 Tax=Spirosoma sordidisoli TaxID=2502893 RepID=A0A4Q2UHJ4_9BACT|nr:DoxX family protein [Spirosoma sordidisoli]RYC68873.1 DoxX family protein [Spirosoma sordidisoli]